MRVRLPKYSGRIALPKNFASLERIDEEGNYVYKFRYTSDLKKLLGPSSAGSTAAGSSSGAPRAITVHINVLKNIVFEKRVRVFDVGFKPEDVIKRLRNRFSLQKQLNRRRQSLRLKQHRSDISKVIPNDKARFLSKDFLNTGKFEGNPERGRVREQQRSFGMFRHIQSSVVSMEGLDVGKRVAPILELNLNKFDQNQDLNYDSEKIRLESMRLLLQNCKDPADWMGRKTRSIFPGMKQHGGILSKSSFFSRNQRDPLIKHKVDSLVRSYLNKRTVSQHVELTSQQFVSVIEKVENDIAHLEETMTLDPSLITGDSFIVEFALVDNKGVFVQKLHGVVKHARNVSLLRRPVLPPTMCIAPFGSKGRNLIELQQMDENASKIAVYRKEIRSSRFNLNDDFERIEVVDADLADGKIYLEDSFISNNPVIYRAIPVGVAGDLGAEFSSVVTKSRHIKTSATENRLRRPSFLSLYNEIRETTMTLFIDNIPSEPISLEVHRRDASTKSSFSLVETVYLEQDSARPVQVEDVRLKPGRIYEYKCKLLFADGAKIWAGNNLIVEYTPLESNIVNVDIQNLFYDQDADTVDVTFDIVKKAIPTELDDVKAQLEAQNITEYDQDIVKQKHRLEDLFFTRVVRQNLRSGETEDFGIVRDETFSDVSLGPVKNVSELAAGGSYKYAVVVYSRPAETMIPEFTRTINSGSIDEYELNPVKFRHPVTLSEEGSLVTETSLKRNHAESAFTQGKVVDIKYVDVHLGDRLPQVQSAKVEVVNSTRTLLTWRLKGDETLVDHFIIILEINGMRTIVGKSHAVGGRNSFQFIDLLDNGEHGYLNYIIVPVYYDFSRGPERRLRPIAI